MKFYLQTDSSGRKIIAKEVFDGNTLEGEVEAESFLDAKRKFHYPLTEEQRSRLEKR